MKQRHPFPELHAVLIAVGATWREAKHCRLYRLPDGRVVTISRTPSDHRARRAIVADLRRVGIPIQGGDLPWPR